MGVFRVYICRNAAVSILSSPQHARSCCNNSPYHVVIANTPASSPLVPKTHLHLFSIALPIEKSKSCPAEMNVGVMRFQLVLHIHSVCVALIISFMMCFMCFFFWWKSLQRGKMVHFQFSECVFFGTLVQ